MGRAQAVSADRAAAGLISGLGRISAPPPVFGGGAPAQSEARDPEPVFRPCAPWRQMGRRHHHGQPDAQRDARGPPRCIPTAQARRRCIISRVGRAEAAAFPILDGRANLRRPGGHLLPRRRLRRTFGPCRRSDCTARSTGRRCIRALFYAARCPEVTANPRGSLWLSP